MKHGKHYLVLLLAVLLIFTQIPVLRTEAAGTTFLIALTSDSEAGTEMASDTDATGSAASDAAGTDIVGSSIDGTDAAGSAAATEMAGRISASAGDIITVYLTLSAADTSTYTLTEFSDLITYDPETLSLLTDSIEPAEAFSYELLTMEDGTRAIRFFYTCEENMEDAGGAEDAGSTGGTEGADNAGETVTGGQEDALEGETSTGGQEEAVEGEISIEGQEETVPGETVLGEIAAGNREENQAGIGMVWNGSLPIGSISFSVNDLSDALTVISNAEYEITVLTEQSEISCSVRNLIIEETSSEGGEANSEDSPSAGNDVDAEEVPSETSDVNTEDALPEIEESDESGDEAENQSSDSGESDADGESAEEAAEDSQSTASSIESDNQTSASGKKSTQSSSSNTGKSSGHGGPTGSGKGSSRSKSSKTTGKEAPDLMEEETNLVLCQEAPGGASIIRMDAIQ